MSQTLNDIMQMLNDLQQRVSALAGATPVPQPAPVPITFTMDEALEKLGEMYRDTDDRVQPGRGSWYLLVQDQEGPGVHLREAKYATWSRLFPQYANEEAAEAAIAYMGGEDVIVAIAHALGGK